MKRSIAINLTSGVSCTIRANPGMHCNSNILPPPERRKYQTTAILEISEAATDKFNRQGCLSVMGGPLGKHGRAKHIQQAFQSPRNPNDR